MELTVERKEKYRAIGKSISQIKKLPEIPGSSSNRKAGMNPLWSVQPKSQRQGIIRGKMFNHREAAEQIYN